MIKFFKHLINREKNTKSKTINNAIISFEDLKLQKLAIDLIEIGNNTVLRLVDKTSNFEILLDKEKSFLLSIILQTYTADNNLEKVIKILEEKE